MNLKRWLLLSLSLNVLLCVTAVWMTRRTVVGAEFSRPAAPPAESAPVTISEPREVEIIREAAFDWSQVESEDYRVYLENLRAIGCPEETIRDIITADVDDYFDQRVKELVDGVMDRFWEMVVKGGIAEQEIEKKIDELGEFSKERGEILRTLFEGTETLYLAEQKAEALASMKSQYDFLSEQKIAGLQAIEETSHAERDVQMKQNPDATSQEQRMWLAEIDGRKEERIQALLSPEEYAEYRLRNSEAANLRHGLADLDVSELEMRTIAAMTADKGTNSGIRELLGTERFAAYERSQDNDYQQTLRILERYELPSSTAVEVYQMRQAAMAQVAAIRDDPQRTLEERQALLQAIQAETERAISETLGPKVFQTFRKYQAHWFPR